MVSGSFIHQTLLPIPSTSGLGCLPPVSVSTSVSPLGERVVETETGDTPVSLKVSPVTMGGDKGGDKTRNERCFFRFSVDRKAGIDGGFKKS